MSYRENNVSEGRIYLFDSHTNSVEQIAKFTNYLQLYEVATTKDKVDYFIFDIANFVNFRFLHWTKKKNSWKSLT